MARIHSITPHAIPQKRFKVTLYAAFEGYMIVQDLKRHIEYCIILGASDKPYEMQAWDDTEWLLALVEMDGYVKP